MGLKDRKDRPVSVLFTKEEAEELRELCWQARLPMSGWMRGVILEAARDLAKQIRRQGNEAA